MVNQASALSVVLFLSVLAGSMRAQDDAGSASGSEPLPSLAPFQVSRFWDVFRDEQSGRVDLDALVEQMATVYEIKASSQEVAAEYGPQPHKGAPQALMKDVPGTAERARWSAAPYALQALFELHGENTWDEQQVARAESASSVLKGLKRVPRMRWDAGDMEGCRKTIRAIVRWYEDRLAEPEHFAAMIFTQDDGPFVGLKHKARKLLPEVGSVPLGDDLVLSLGRDKKGAEPFVLQCARGKRVLWSRTISDSPYQTVHDVSFRDEPPTALDGLGWKVHLRVQWRNGAEYAHAYIDAEGQLVCYFMSW